MRDHVWTAKTSLLVGVVALAMGCGGQRINYEMVEVSGKVSYKGRPLPGGRITFTADQGGLAAGANLDENGNYKVTAPVGPVKITVDNRGLDTSKRGPRGGPILRNPNQEGPTDMPGHYVEIPNKYYETATTDLTYTVKSGEQQTHDIKLE
jgi:hypothetical protein